MSDKCVSIARFIEDRFKTNYTNLSELASFVKFEADDIGQVFAFDFVPVNKVKLSSIGKYSLISELFTGVNLWTLLDNIDDFDLIVGKNSVVPADDDIYCRPVVTNTPISYLIPEVSRVLKAKIAKVRNELEAAAKQLANNLYIHNSRHGETHILRTIKHGRCELQIRKVHLDYEIEDYASFDRELLSLQKIYQGDGELFTMCFELKWDGESVQHTALEGFIMDLGKKPLALYKRAVRMQIDNVMLCARSKLISSGKILSRDVKQDRAFFGSLNIGTNA
ncbi:hypothetical protein [Vibrio cholerae]|uniref:Uncharacterized protein n=1 Tax=Vibrio cholerae TaxID=666 RepID=A0A7Z7YDB7_VIBCL|nr:hypothetical protein [Vibrio cholerae]PNV69321.1 hypothetical protein C1Y48_18970 [Vibrio cholerae]TBM39645.1 hypothetical protein EYB64_16415 [Vibrio cholerae]